MYLADQEKCTPVRDSRNSFNRGPLKVFKASVSFYEHDRKIHSTPIYGYKIKSFDDHPISQRDTHLPSLV